MKALDRLKLVDRIGRALQERMTFSDIDEYLKVKGVDIGKDWSGANSKWVYSKEMLAGESDALVLEIADDLEVPHTYAAVPNGAPVEATFWEPLNFRLFLSHLSEFKKPVAALQAALQQYGISAFVAHVDIEPTKEWQDEIEAGLASMDAMAAILHAGFKESNWTDQEVGYAMGRGVLVIPVIRDINPYGFLGKFQGLQAYGKNVQMIASEIFGILVTSPKTRSRMLTCLVDSALQSVSPQDGLTKLGHLAAVAGVPDSYFERMREGASGSAVFAQSEPLARLNAILVVRGMKSVEAPGGSGFSFDDDIPF